MRTYDREIRFIESADIADVDTNSKFQIPNS
jgi:hypothetical protein